MSVVQLNQWVRDSVGRANPKSDYVCSNFRRPAPRGPKTASGSRWLLKTRQAHKGNAIAFPLSPSADFVTEPMAAKRHRARSLAVVGVDSIADELGKAGSPNRLKAALKVPKLAPITAPSAGPIDPEQIVREAVEDEDKKARSWTDDRLDKEKNLPLVRSAFARSGVGWKRMGVLNLMSFFDRPIAVESRCRVIDLFASGAI